MPNDVVWPIEPKQYAVFDPDPEVPLYFVTTPECARYVRCEARGDHRVHCVAWNAGQSLAATISGLPEPSYVVVAAPGRLVISPTAAEIGYRKLACFPCASTPMPAEAVARSLRTFGSTDPLVLERRASTFFGAVASAEAVVITDERYGAVATFSHFAETYSWNQQAGYVGWGEQQVAPGGELSVLPGDVMAPDGQHHLALDGELVLQGTPIVHAGSFAYEEGEQDRLYSRLSSLGTSPVLLSVAAGRVTRCRPLEAGGADAAGALEDLFGGDPRYCTVMELGFGINPWLEIEPGNRAVNEVFGGRNGVFHVGFGLTPWTQFAPIVVCPGATVRTHDGKYLCGARPSRPLLTRTKASSCGCL